MATKASTSIKSAFDRLARGTEKDQRDALNEKEESEHFNKLSKESQAAAKRIQDRPPADTMDPTLLIIRMFRNGLDFAKVFSEIDPNSKARFIREPSTLFKMGWEKLKDKYYPGQALLNKAHRANFEEEAEKIAKDAHISVDDKGLLEARPPKGSKGQEPGNDAKQDFQDLAVDFLHSKGFDTKAVADRIEVSKNGQAATKKEISDALGDDRKGLKDYMTELSKKAETVSNTIPDVPPPPTPSSP